MWQWNSFHAGSWQALQVRVQVAVNHALCVGQLWAQGWKPSMVPLMIVKRNPCKADWIFTPRPLNEHLDKDAFVYPCCWAIIFWLVLARLIIFWTHSSRAVISSSSDRWTDIVLFHSVLMGFKNEWICSCKITLNAQWICSYMIHELSQTAKWPQKFVGDL